MERTDTLLAHGADTPSELEELTNPNIYADVINKGSSQNKLATFEQVINEKLDYKESRQLNKVEYIQE